MLEILGPTFTDYENLYLLATFVLFEEGYQIFFNELKDIFRDLNKMDPGIFMENMLKECWQLLHAYRTDTTLEAKMILFSYVAEVGTNVDSCNNLQSELNNYKAEIEKDSRLLFELIKQSKQLLSIAFTPNTTSKPIRQKVDDDNLQPGKRLMNF